MRSDAPTNGRCSRSVGTSTGRPRCTINSSRLTTEAGLWGIATAEIGIQTVNASRTFQFVSYWFAALYAVIEGWRTLGLSDPEVDRLLSDDEKVATLRRLRAIEEVLEDGD